VTRRRGFDIAILGGGPAGLVAALAAAKSARTLLVLNRPVPHGAPLRIDAVPAQTLALLAELGIPPRALGVKGLHDRQGASWESGTPTWKRGAKTGHIERPRLERALLDAVRAHGRIRIVADGTRPKFDGDFCGRGWRAKHLIDATGRAAVTAQARVRFRPASASRFFWIPRDATHATAEFRIAALPSGYAYRLGSAEHIGIGIVGRGALLKADPAGLDRLLNDDAWQWLCEDMPPLQAMNRGSSGVTSVQWAVPGPAALIGDASIARDPLSSQGLAASLSDALYAVAAIMTGDADSLHARQTENLRAHLMYLQAVLMQCRYLDNAHWTAYERFIAANIAGRVDRPASALRHGRLEMMPEY
jgi:2-polyprenyl-6-methoxyphenol hydroxylase-like FAD-dependent oxidoreductase